MMDHAHQTISSPSGSASLQRLIRFAQDMGRLTNPSIIAERILSELATVAQCEEGSLYLVDRERELYRRLTTQGAIHPVSAPPTIPFPHPLVRHLAEVQHISGKTTLDRTASRTPAREDISSALDSLSANLAIPLVNKGRLVAFALLSLPTDIHRPDADSLELLTAIAQNAANALDFILVYEDLRQSQTLMRRTDRLRSLEIIAGGFAHEIRNPLTSIKTFIQLAPERKDDAEFIRDFSRVVLDDVHRIERLIQEILDYARYMEPKLTEEDLNDIVSSCLYFIEVKADSRGIKIEKELASELPRVMLDRQQIKQVLLNLLLNAMDAMGERGGLLRVKTDKLMKSDGQNWVQIHIEDTGHGISAANLDHIFDPFFTTKHTSGENEGTGLGLTIAHQIVQEHRGEIQVQSTEGVGTTFRIDLPSLV
jgi:signal transduction histidine kinase